VNHPSLQRSITRKCHILIVKMTSNAVNSIILLHFSYWMLIRNEQFGVLQVIDENNSEEAEKFINHWKSYMVEVMEKPQFAGVRDRCKNQHELCSFWSMLGECAK
jgi:hypothetical protein